MPKLKAVPPNAAPNPELEVALAQLEELINQPAVAALITRYTTLILAHAAVSANPMKTLEDATALGLKIKALITALE